MFNLLPEVEKKSIESAYVARRYQLLFTFLLLTILAALVFLTPSFIVAKYSQREANIELENARLVLSGNNQEFGRQLAEVQRKVVALDNQAPVGTSEFIATVVGHRGSGIKVNHIFYHKPKNATSTLVVKGVARTRENLLLFVEKLKTEEAFVSATFPVSNFTKDRDIEFNVDVVLK